METRVTEYRNALDTSLRVGFRLEDVLPDGAHLDLSQRLLPDALTGADALPFLAAHERLTVNHLRAHSYLGLFGLVEEFILPFVVDHARQRLNAEPFEVRALLQFAAEEAKHIHLFKRFVRRFEEDFGGGCALIGPADDIARAVLAHHPIGVALAILHIEWMTQRHYIESVRDGAIDPLMKRLLKSHYLEEVQHAQLDTLMVEELSMGASDADLERGRADYHRIVAILDGGLCQQSELDRSALEERMNRRLSWGERAAYDEVQRASYRRVFLESGARHPRFFETYQALGRA
jgi:hypothetical protein